ncbi:MAG: DUF1801 domain-containing protein [Chitinophagaceae bacterium]|nr:DUF1801 domain-containing protein [Chitinophagaceae bacterium]
MQSKAANVDLYLKEVPADRLAALTKIRQLCLEELKGYKETMRYGMPCYEKNNIAEIGFASQKNNIALYILKLDVMQKYKGELKGVSTGKGCIRFTKPDKIDFDVVKKMLSGTFASTNTICG